VAQDSGSDRQRKNIMIGQRRTSVSLEDRVWDGLVDVCRREELSIDDLCTRVDEKRLASSLSSSLRVFQLTYFRIVVDNAEKLLSRRPAEGFAHPPQALFPSVLEVALERFSADQRRYSGQG
jgi:predicted DNA-binding ribbon-helix-helix protein